MRIKLIVLFVGFLIITACHQPPVGKIRDLIQPLSLVAGQTDSFLLSDIYYAEDYNVVFSQNPDVEVKYDRQKKTISLYPNDGFEGQSLLDFSWKGVTYSIPVFVKIQQTKNFTFTPPKKYNKITLFGAFNSWNRDQLIMTDEDKDGTYEIEIPIDPGRYEYLFWVDGEEIVDPANPVQAKNPFGKFNSVLNMAPRVTENAYLHLLGVDEKGDALTYNFLYEGTRKGFILTPDHVFALNNNQRIPQDQIKIDGNKISLLLNTDQLQGERTIRISAADGGIIAPLKSIFLKDSQPLSPQDDSFNWKEGILYSIMIDRFYDGNPDNNRPVDHPELDIKGNYQGGDLQGVLYKLNEGYFSDMGINVIWLSPVNDNTDNAYRDWPPPHRYFSGYHGYWPVHHQKIESCFGDEFLLKKVVNTAHKQGIKVILDYVSNHTHIDHPFFKEHRDWYGNYELPDGRKNIRLFDEFRLTTWFEPFLPSFDYENSEEALQVMTDNAVWWLNQYDLDGFRHDAVKHIPNHFWRVLTQKINKEVEIPQNKKVYQVGETFGSYKMVNSYVNNGQMDAQFNFSLFETARDVILHPNISFNILKTELNKTFDVYGRHHVMGNLMDSHDKVRFMAYADGDITKASGNPAEIGWTHPPKVDHPESYRKALLYMAYMLTVPGIPTLYYGDEIGMTGAADPDNRRMMRFNDAVNDLEKEMKNVTGKIVGIRRTHSALCYGDFLPLLADKDCFAYLRSDVNERILVVLNKSEKSQIRSIQIPQWYQFNMAVDLISQKPIKWDDHHLEINLNGLDWKIIQIQ